MCFSTKYRLLSLVFLYWFGVTGSAYAEPGFLREELRIPMAEAGPEGLETLLIKPEGAGPFPLALINHGSIGPIVGSAQSAAAERLTMTPAQLNARLLEFARRGFVAVAFMRRGYGNSPGGFAEDFGSCSQPDYASAAKNAAADLIAATNYLSSRADVDAQRILAVGHSGGGFATVALTADPPPGLVAAINFEGGRGSAGPDSEVCGADELVSTFAMLGARSRVPMLWVYAENDRRFGPALAERFRNAFVAAGGHVSFIKAPPYGKDGHGLFESYNSRPIWEPIVDDFLRTQGLYPKNGLLPRPPLPDIATPEGLGFDGPEQFRSYLAAAPHKAFAMTLTGHFGWRSGQRTEEDAIAGAFSACPGGKADCHLVMINDQPVAK